MYAKSFKVSALSECIKKASNLVENEFKFPSLTYLHKFRIVVCTLLTAGSLVRARSKDIGFDPNHFSHVIIDEAASTQEPISMISIAGIYYFQIYLQITTNQFRHFNLIYKQGFVLS